MLAGFDRGRRAALFDHCIALTLNAVQEPYNRRPRALAHADMPAAELGLEIPRRVARDRSELSRSRHQGAHPCKPCARRRARRAAERIAGLKKPDMVTAAEELLDGTGWLPQPLRTPRRGVGVAAGPGNAHSAADGGEPAMADAVFPVAG